MTPALPGLRPFTVGFHGEAAAGRARDLLRAVEARVAGEVRLRRHDFDDPSCGLLSGQYEPAIVGTPLDVSGPETVTITTDRRRVPLPATDPLAQRAEGGPGGLGGRVCALASTSTDGHCARSHVVIVPLAG
ncbi:hypothetical protein ACFYXS_27880 [Streptomyces sp. NPDC002574]|uniref:hypothetical protein n=1 Tax=Streptomyces sp. NPDC002574 TaxID=3364652 RepID=UPI0036C4792D